jgi:hypothetical protein
MYSEAQLTPNMQWFWLPGFAVNIAKLQAKDNNCFKSLQFHFCSLQQFFPISCCSVFAEASPDRLLTVSSVTSQRRSWIAWYPA